MKNYESLVDALSDLKKRGYEANFETDTVCLYCGDLDIRLNPEAFNVDEVYRFEGDSNPDDSSIVYAISSNAGVKGTLVDAYGAYSQYLNFEMAQKLHGLPSLAQ
jgi:hypothetical protein